MAKNETTAVIASEATSTISDMPSQNNVESKIVMVRNVQVILDKDLAKL